MRPLEAALPLTLLLLSVQPSRACTSFADYSSGSAWYGMNFDWHPGTEILFRIETGMDGTRVFTMSFVVDGRPVPTAGMTADGRFSCMQVTDAPWTGPPPGSGNPYIFTPFYAVVYRGASMDDIRAMILNDTFVQYDDPPLHVMVADASGRAVVIEVGEEGNDVLERTGEPFVVMTNFSCRSWLGAAPEEIEGCGADRYRRALDVLSENEGRMSPAIGMAVLEAARNTSEGFPTRASMVFDASSATVHIVPAGEFENIWSVDIGTGRIALPGGCGRSTMVLDSTGVTVSDLAALR